MRSLDHLQRLLGVRLLRVELDDAVVERGGLLRVRERRRCDGLRLDAHVEERAERMVLRRVGYDVVRERRGDPPLGLDALEEEDEEVVAALAHEGGQDALAGVVVEGGEESALIGEGLEVRRERKTYLDGLEDAADGRVGI